MALDNALLTGWMVAAGRGDEGAFGHLARALHGQLWGVALRLTGGHKANAEDALQEALVKLWRYAPRWEAGGSVAAYATRLVHTSVMDGYRAAGPLSNDVPEVPVAEGVTGKIFAKQRRDALLEAMDSLPERQRQAVGLAYFKEKSTREVAAELGATEGATELLLVRARKALGKILPRNLMGEV